MPTPARAPITHTANNRSSFAARGAFTVHCDDGEVTTAYTLSSPDEALLLPPMVFHRLDNFAPGSLCLVLASGQYDPHEYVTDYARVPRADGSAVTKIPFLDLAGVHAEIADELEAAFSRVLGSGRYLRGSEVEQFEREFAEYCGQRAAVGVGNGLAALQ